MQIMESISLNMDVNMDVQKQLPVFYDRRFCHDYLKTNLYTG